MSQENENLRDSIKPEDIVFDEKQVDDADMPRPETKLYTKYLKTTPLFLELFHRCVDTLPYKSVFATEVDGQIQRIRLLDFVRFVESNSQKMPIDEMNRVLSYIADIDFRHARPLMEVVENKDAQSKLWSVFEE